MNLVSKTVTVNFRIDEYLYKAARDFHIQYGKEIKGFLLGPKEILSLGAIMHAQHKYGPSLGLVYPSEFMGIPIRAKLSPGVDIEVEASDAGRYAAGLISQTFDINQETDKNG